jgi:hypothetical protein
MAREFGFRRHQSIINGGGLFSKFPRGSQHLLLWPQQHSSVHHPPPSTITTINTSTFSTSSSFFPSTPCSWGPPLWARATADCGLLPSVTTVATVLSPPSDAGESGGRSDLSCCGSVCHPVGGLTSVSVVGLPLRRSDGSPEPSLFGSRCPVVERHGW